VQWIVGKEEETVFGVIWEDSFWGNMGGNTYQTYIWTESYYEVSSKAQIKQEFERQQIQTEVDRTKSVPIYDKY